MHASCAGESARSPRCRIELAAARGVDAPGGGAVSYWISAPTPPPMRCLQCTVLRSPTHPPTLRSTVTPEVETDYVVDTLRRSWLRGAGDDARFCVASGMSTSTDPSLHWLSGLNRSESVASGRSDLNSRLHEDKRDRSLPPPAAPPANGPVRSAAAMAAKESAQVLKLKAEKARELTRIYNNFLRHKVFQIMRDMCSSLTTRTFDFAFMMDADTVVNRTNLENFVSTIDLTVPVYTGLCKRRSTWASQNQRGVGGGPGILFSRSLLQAACPSLEQCAPLRSMMDRLHFAGGDLMLGAPPLNAVYDASTAAKVRTLTVTASRISAVCSKVHGVSRPYLQPREGDAVRRPGP